MGAKTDAKDHELALKERAMKGGPKSPGATKGGAGDDESSGNCETEVLFGVV